MNRFTLDSAIHVSQGKQTIHVMKEIKKIENDPNLNKTTKFIINESNITSFIMLIEPFEGLYKGTSIPFRLTVPSMYPAPGNPIHAECIDPIYHPNIARDGKLCLHYDSVGDMESGYKETLENLVIGINYLFIHPGNYTNENIPNDFKETVLANVKDYINKRNTLTDERKKGNLINKDSKIKIQGKEHYGDSINQSLKKIKDWESYFPSRILNQKNKKSTRCYVMTLNGQKTLDIARIDDVISQMIHDPRVIFTNISNCAYSDNKYDFMVPKTPNNVIMTKLKRIVMPTSFHFNPILEYYNMNMSLIDLVDMANLKMKKTPTGNIEDNLKLLCNIVIECNYEFKFVVPSFHNNKIIPVIESKQTSNGVYQMTIDNLLHNANKYIEQNHLVLCKEPLFNKPLWLSMECSYFILGQDVGFMFQNVAFNINPTDLKSQLVKLCDSKNKDQDIYMGDYNIRSLTSEEMKELEYISNDSQNDINTKIEVDSTIVNKYIATTKDEINIDLSLIKYIK